MPATHLHKGIARDEHKTDVPVEGPITTTQRPTSAMTILLCENYASSNNNDIEKEIDMFLKYPLPLFDSSPTEWWKVNEARFPSQHPCIPATSVSSEHVFSAAGITINRLRTQLTPDHVDMLIFLNKNTQV